MKLYFRENAHYDYSRQGHDWVDIEYSLREFNGGVCYSVEIGDGYTEVEAERLACKAIGKALAKEIGVEEALNKLLKRNKK